MHWLLLGRHPDLDGERKLPRQMIMVGLSVSGVMAIILALPVTESTRNQALALLGVLASGVVALSSTTVVANFMAGIMLRTTRPFKIGDFIRVAEHFGRVAERGLLDVEIQTEQRELISFPNNPSPRAALAPPPSSLLKNAPPARSSKLASPAQVRTRSRRFSHLGD